MGTLILLQCQIIDGLANLSMAPREGGMSVPFWRFLGFLPTCVTLTSG